MNILYKYYASILGLIRFLGIGVGNENARASTVFTITILLFLSVIANFLGANVLNLGSIVLIIIVISSFFLVYSLFSKTNIQANITNWLKSIDAKQKILAGTLSAIFAIVTTILFLKIYV